MRSKLLSSILYLLVACAFWGIMNHLDMYFLHRYQLDRIVTFGGLFLIILFCLCYRSYYASFWASVSLAFYSYLLSAAIFFLIIRFMPPERFDWDDSNRISLIYSFICLGLPVPCTYAIWYIDWYIGSRMKKNG